MKTILTFIATSTLISLAFGASAFAQTGRVGRGGGSSVGGGNPASMLCIEIGGDSEITTNPDGSQGGQCRIEEWKLFQAMDNLNLVRRPKPTRRGGPIGMANPASVNCSLSGGMLTIVNRADGQIGICTLNDRRLMSAFRR